MKKLFLLSSIVLIFASCARRYRDIPPSAFNYENKKSMSNDINVYYRNGVQDFAQNKPYARKERRKNLRLIAVKIENLGDTTIRLRKENFIITTNSGSVVRMVPYELYTKEIRQYAETFFIFYGLAGVGYYQESSPAGTSSTITFSPFPLLIGAGNGIYAYSSNQKQVRYLAENDIFNKPIPPKTSIYGLITIQQTSIDELNFSYSTDTYY